LKGVVGILPANQSDDGEDVYLYENEAARDSKKPMNTYCMLLQQAEKESDGPYFSQSDFIALHGYTFTSIIDCPMCTRFLPYIEKSKQIKSLHGIRWRVTWLSSELVDGLHKITTTIFAAKYSNLYKLSLTCSLI